jgi:hypothetical protein
MPPPLTRGVNVTSSPTLGDAPSFTLRVIPPPLALGDVPLLTLDDGPPLTLGDVPPLTMG